MEHENDPDIDQPYVPPAENVLGGATDEQSAEQTQPNPECMSLHCYTS